MPSLTICLLGVPEAERAALVSAVNIASRAIENPLRWTEASEATLCILDVASDAQPGERQIAIRYTSDRGRADAELSRPIRPAALMTALRTAVAAAAAREAADTPLEKGAAWYRGAPLAARSEPPVAPSPSLRGVIYRGVRIAR